MDLFTYPQDPGFKEHTTSKDAAESMKPTAPILRQMMREALAFRDMTADECAAHCGVSELAMRPRFSEGKQSKIIEETGERRKNESGRMAKVWRLT